MSEQQTPSVTSMMIFDLANACVEEIKRGAPGDVLTIYMNAVRKTRGAIEAGIDISLSDLSMKLKTLRSTMTHEEDLAVIDAVLQVIHDARFNRNRSIERTISDPPLMNVPPLPKA